MVDLCHSVQHTAQAVSDYGDIPKEELDYWVDGINYMAWFLEMEYDGEITYSALYEAMDDLETYKRDNGRFDILRHFDAFVTE